MFSFLECSEILTFSFYEFLGVLGRDHRSLISAVNEGKRAALIHVPTKV